jgi:ribonuclease HI
VVSEGRIRSGDRDQDRRVVIYTDGGCRGNPGPGAWAAVVLAEGERREISGVEALTTNNRMELIAAIRGLELLTLPSRVLVVTDSDYLRMGITTWMKSWIARGWRTSDRKSVKNRDLWERLVELCSAHQTEWKWVPAHSGHPENERCDALVNQALDALAAGGPPGGGGGRAGP